MEKTYALEPEIVDFVRQAASGDCYGAYLRNTLMELMAFDTTGASSPAEAARAEAECFDWLNRELEVLIGPDAVCQRVTMPASPAERPNAGATDEPDRGTASEARCAGRTNMRVTLPGASADSAPGIVLHAHIDGPAPHLPPRSAGERVFGRGACEGKAQLALLLAQIKLLAELENKLDRKATRGRIYHFTIDGHRDGAGALALAAEGNATDTPVLLHQPTGLVPQVGQYGWLFYRCRLTNSNGTTRTALEIFPFVVEALEEEAQRLRDESDQPPFDAARVRGYPTCLGRFGTPAERFCTHVLMEIVTRTKANPQRVGMKIIEFLEEAMDGYVERYGDMTREKDPVSGRPRLERHFDLRIVPDPEAQRFNLEVYGCRPGGPLLDNGDSAIVKAACLLGALIRVAMHFPEVEAFCRLLDGGPDDRTLILQGGQSFSASHNLADVRQRLTDAARRGVENYCRARRQRPEADIIAMDWDYPQREAFAEPTDSAAVEALHLAFQAVGEPWPRPSADACGGEALIYHSRKHPVAAFGAGRLENIRWDEEYIDIPDLQKSLAISTLAAWSLIR